MHRLSPSNVTTECEGDLSKRTIVTRCNGLSQRHRYTAAFTLIELSIVLVIIGLIVGGVLVGRDLIKAAEVRATITQIEKYNTAANTFRGKYGYLPGDIKDPDASSFGLQARGQYAGEGDGNGIIEGAYLNSAGQNCGVSSSSGEAILFWADLSAVRLIEGSFTSVSSGLLPNNGANVTNVGNYLPQAKVGNGNYVYVWSGGIGDTSGNGGGSNVACATTGNGTNYFGIEEVDYLNGSTLWGSSPGLTVQQAYAIDRKVDDGQPQAGRVIATFNDANNGFLAAEWAAGGGSNQTGAHANILGGGGNPTTSPTPGTSTTCYDNGNVSGATQQYSMTISNGANVNCALSFRFQ